jgi:hypothetical protein
VDEGLIPPRFEGRNLRDTHNPALDIVGQKHEIVALKYRASLCLRLVGKTRLLIILMVIRFDSYANRLYASHRQRNQVDPCRSTQEGLQRDVFFLPPEIDLVSV